MLEKNKPKKEKCDLLKDDGKPCNFKSPTAQGLSSHKRLSPFHKQHQISVYGPKPEKSQQTKSKEEMLKVVQEIKSDSDLAPGQKENLELVKDQLINETEEEKIKQQREKEIQEKSQTRRDKKEDLELMKIEEQIDKRQEKSSAPDDIDKLLARRERIAIIKSIEQQPPQNSQELKDRYDFEMKMQDKLHQLAMANSKQSFDFMKQQVSSSEKKMDPLDAIAKFKTLAPDLGFTKGEGEGGTSKIFDFLTANFGVLQTMWKDYMWLKQSQQQSGFPTSLPIQQNPTQQIEESGSNAVGNLDSHSGSGDQTPAPDQSEIEMSVPQPQPAGNPEPSDAELMAMPETRDSSYSGIGDYAVDLDQSLGIGEKNLIARKKYA